MRVLNETTDELSLIHASVAQLTAGGSLTILGMVLFTASVLGTSDALAMAQAAAALFALGLVVLFANMAETVELDKRGGQIRRRTRRFLLTRTHSYPLAAATRVELREARMTATPLVSRVEAFLVLADGTRIRIGDARPRLTTHPMAPAVRVARFLELPLSGPFKG